MNKKPFTPDNCPLIPGSVIYDPDYNLDILVLARALNYDDEHEEPNSGKILVKICYGSTPLWYSGKELMTARFEYYPHWPDTSETKPCYHEVEGRELIKDYLNDPVEDFSETVDTIYSLFGLDSMYIQCSVNKYHNKYCHTDYFIIPKGNDFYKWLDDYIQCCDCKNGCQIYKDDDGYYFCITGSNYYDDETEEYKGTDEVHIRFKPYNWQEVYYDSTGTV